MGDIVFNISGGAPNYTVLLSGYGGSWLFTSAGEKTLHDIPTGTYTLTVTDSLGCECVIGGIIIPEAITTTTTVIPVTTTTTTAEVTTTTTTVGLTTTTSTTVEVTTTTTTIEITTTTTTEFVGCVEYGALYNWFAATDARNIAPAGWHVPSLSEMITLRIYLDPLHNNPDSPNDNIAGGLMKEIGTTYWNSPNTGATNESGFSGRGAGARSSVGNFIGIKSSNSYWCSDDQGEAGAGAGSLFYNQEYFYVATYSGGNKELGRSLCLIMDGVNPDDPGTMTGNDGKIYKTVKIGNQVWMTENLAETEYRDHSPICEVQDNTAWAALTTGAMCAYNNDYSKVGCGFAGGTMCTTTTSTTSEPTTTTTTIP